MKNIPNTHQNTRRLWLFPLLALPVWSAVRFSLGSLALLGRLEYGMNVSHTKILVASAFGALTFGTFLARRKWLSIRRRLIYTGLLACLLATLQANAPTALTMAIASCGFWVCIGYSITSITILIGTAVETSQKAAALSISSVFISLTAVISSPIAGVIDDSLGLRAVFIAAGLVFLAQSGFSLMIPEVPSHPRLPPVAVSAVAHGEANKIGLALLLVAIAVYWYASASAALTRSLDMLAEGFTSAEIANVITFGGIASLLGLVLIELSDRIGHMRMLVLLFAVGCVGLLLMATAKSYNQFALATAVLFLADTCRPVGSLLVAKMPYPDDDTQRQSLSAFDTAIGTGQLLGFAAAYSMYTAIAAIAAGCILLVLVMVFFPMERRT